jgi:uncharacterized protein (DUF427 family)
MRVPDVVKRLAHATGAHRITTRASARHVEVACGDVVLARSDRAIELEETGAPTRFYLPREDVRTDLLAASDTTTHCPFKGDAAWFSAPGCSDAFWVYDNPSEDAALPIAGRLAPHPGRVAVRVTPGARGPS